MFGMWAKSGGAFQSIATGERTKLFQAAHKLLMFVLREASAQTLNEEERALREALRPLVENEDGHFIAAVTALVQSLLEGRTGCPIMVYLEQAKRYQLLP